MLQKEWANVPRDSRNKERRKYLMSRQTTENSQGSAKGMSSYLIDTATMLVKARVRKNTPTTETMISSAAIAQSATMVFALMLRMSQNNSIALLSSVPSSTASGTETIT